MATYKVLQDIEAEDKIVGPLTLRQFIYACITVLCLYVCFILLTKGAPFLIPIFLLPGLLTGFFAYPFARDQPTEIWALAKIRFWVKPRRRLWNQSGVKELVTITAPRRVEQHLTNGLSQTEVRSRLRALADTIDSRGWAIKNADNQYSQSILAGNGQDSDRLVSMDTLPQEVPALDARATEDVLDEANPAAVAFDTMMQRSDQTHRQQIMRSMAQAQTGADSQTTADLQLPQPQVIADDQPAAPPANDQWFTDQPAVAQVVVPGATTSVTTADEPTADEKALAERLRQQNNSLGVSYAHLHTVLPLSQQGPAQKTATQAPVTRQPDPAIIALARNNDLNVATIAREANKQTREAPDEVIISLH